MSKIVSLIPGRVASLDQMSRCQMGRLIASFKLFYALGAIPDFDNISLFGTLQLHLPTTVRSVLQNYVDVLSTLLGGARQDPAGAESLQLQGLVKEIARLSQVCLLLLDSFCKEKRLQPAAALGPAGLTLLQEWSFLEGSKRLKLPSKAWIRICAACLRRCRSNLQGSPCVIEI